MFSQIVEKLVGSGSNLSPFEVALPSGVTIKTIGEAGLSTLFELGKKLGWLSDHKSLPAPAAPVLMAPPHIEQVAQDVEQAPPIIKSEAPAHESLQLDAPSSSFTDSDDPSLLASLTHAINQALAGGQAHMEMKVAEMIAAHDTKDFCLFSQAMVEFKSTIDPKQMHHSSVGEYEFISKSFVDIVGDKNIAAIRSKDINHYLDCLSHLPPNPMGKPEYEKMDFKQVVVKAKSIGAKAIQISTQKKHVNFLRAFFSWCFDALDLKRDPTRGIRLERYARSDTQAHSDFNEADLRKIFEPTLRSKLKKPFMYWIPLISLYSSMRINEVAQLSVDDIKPIEVGFDKLGNAQTILCFDLSRRGGKKLKTKNAERLLPVHSRLIELGLLTYLEDIKRRGFKHLFQGLKWGLNGPGATVSAWFNEGYLRNKCGITDSQKVFHSFRNTFWTLGDRSKGVLETALIKLAGYGRGQSVQRVHYIRQADVEECKKALEAIEYPVLDLQPYNPKKFEAYLAAERLNAKPEELVDVPVKKPVGRPRKEKP